MSLRQRVVIPCALFAVCASVPALSAQSSRYPPLEDYMMQREAEIALARSAAPSTISGSATIKVLTASGYEVAHQGDNGFVCMVMRAWTAPTYTPAPLRDLVYDAAVRAPICFDPEAARIVMPYYELRSKLGTERKTPDEIAAGVERAYASGELPLRDRVSFAYMWSEDQYLGPQVGSWHPHMMIFAAYQTNKGLGGNDFGQTLPFVSDDEGTPFAVVVVPVDDDLAIEAGAGSSPLKH